MPSLNLEYEEEDLFSETENTEFINTATPIAGPSRPRLPPPDAEALRPIPPAPPVERLPLLKPTVPFVGLARLRPRLQELRELKYVRPGVVTVVGPVSLKEQCMAVIKTHSTRIWDIGDTEYSVIKDFIDTLPAEQLAAIEEASPAIRKDSDWLWEYHMLTDFAILHEKYATRHGEKRTSGWRRVYKKAAEEARERQQNAASRVAERYKEMDQMRADKRIVVLDRVIPPKVVKRTTTGTFGTQKQLSVTAKPVGMMGKARADAQRARIAMTHASGKFVGRPGSRQSSIASTASASSSSAIPNRLGTQDQSRIPGTKPKPKPPLLTHPDGLIPGAYPTPEYQIQRSALPSHLASLPSPKPSTPPERLIIDENKRKFSTKRPAQVPSFQPPDPKPPAARADFFGSATQKRPRSNDEGIKSSPLKIVRFSPKESNRSGGASNSLPTSAGDSPKYGSGSSGVGIESTKQGMGISVEAANKLKGVLFRSKPKPRALGR